uniref:exopolysaccharide biosynthesis polyprenyl glycosylphosphotransferase n=1 Tax=Eubacterium cellulosolvens TaxID=29322 RepID=UPI0006881DC0|nr:exopolysaccharide biosynthesis polyprenyl glycosylphosphotransferase [[Eubacterium] cellulosolvens]
MENKQITHTARTLLRIWNTGWFAFVWIRYYNVFMFNTYRTLGALFSILTFYIVYSWLCNVYKAFRFASTDVGEIVFSQFISFAAADLLLYIECVLVYNQLRNLLPGLGIVGIQLAGTMLIALEAKRYFMRHVARQKTLVIYGTKTDRLSALRFEKILLRKYDHLFDILYTEQETISEDQLIQFIQGVDTAILYKISPEQRFRFTNLCLEMGKNFYFTPDLEDVIETGCEAKHLLDTPLMKYEYSYQNSKDLVLKRALDIFFSMLFLIILSPFMLVTAVAIRLEDHGPVFYRQKRYTKDGKIFDILKFRSMIVDAEKNGVQPSTDGDPRITKVGEIIRKTRFDEVPQFLNILKGDMSFVGPRPERVEHVDLYMQEIPQFRYRMAMKGGLTGYAQVFGKYNTTAEDKLLLDLMYIENQTTLLDFKIALLTIRTIFQKESTEGFDETVSGQINRETAQE